jgi:alpha-N-acetylglucosaminidase
MCGALGECINIIDTPPCKINTVYTWRILQGGLCGVKRENYYNRSFTPEGIDQNPVYYEFMLEANWRTKRVANITEHVVTRSHRRYGFDAVVPEVVTAWEQLVGSVYSQDLGVHDTTGVPHLGGSEDWSFEADNHTPTSTLCMVYTAWSTLIQAGSKVASPLAEPFRYDLVNTGREILAQLAGPAGKNFTAATGAAKINATAVVATGNYYHQILVDVDTLVNTDTAFQLGPWLEMARARGSNTDDTDCIPDGSYPHMSCPDFYEWNARVQLTTWHPTPKGSTRIQLSDYAAKQWSGLIKDYYAARVRLHQEQALASAAKGRPLDNNATALLEAEYAYNWTTATNKYPTTPVGDALTVSAAMQKKYESYFTSC